MLFSFSLWSIKRFSCIPRRQRDIPPIQQRKYHPPRSSKHAKFCGETNKDVLLGPTSRSLRPFESNISDSCDSAAMVPWRSILTGGCDRQSQFCFTAPGHQQGAEIEESHQTRFSCFFFQVFSTCLSKKWFRWGRTVLQSQGGWPKF